MKKLLAFFLIMFYCYKKCSDEETNSGYSENLLKWKLAVKGICLSHMIQLVSLGINKKLIESEWVDEMTGTTYKDVFAL